MNTFNITSDKLIVKAYANSVDPNRRYPPSRISVFWEEIPKFITVIYGTTSRTD